MEDAKMRITKLSETEFMVEINSTVLYHKWNTLIDLLMDLEGSDGLEFSTDIIRELAGFKNGASWEPEDDTRN